MSGTFEQDETVDKSLLIYSEETPHCKIHGAMMLLNGIWRCYGTYKGNVEGIYPKGTKPFKFIDRICNCAISDKEWNENEKKF